MRPVVEVCSIFFGKEGKICKCYMKDIIQGTIQEIVQRAALLLVATKPQTSNQKNSYLMSSVPVFCSSSSRCDEGKYRWSSETFVVHGFILWACCWLSQRCEGVSVRRKCCRDVVGSDRQLWVRCHLQLANNAKRRGMGRMRWSRNRAAVSAYYKRIPRRRISKPQQKQGLPSSK